MELVAFVTPQRLDNVISKIGEVTKDDVSTLIRLLSKDSMADFRKEFGIRFDALPTSQQKPITKKLSLQSGKVVAEYFASNIK